LPRRGPRSRPCPAHQAPGSRAVRRAQSEGIHTVAQAGIKELLEAGVHFGHQTRRWNPKMRRFIYGERDGIYIIDLLQTDVLLRRAQAFAFELARKGGAILFVGTKKQ